MFLYGLIYSSGDISNLENLVKTEVVVKRDRIVIRHISLESALQDLQNDIRINDFCKSQPNYSFHEL
jgi:hypothetical protein